MLTAIPVKRTRIGIHLLVRDRKSNRLTLKIYPRGTKPIRCRLISDILERLIRNSSDENSNRRLFQVWICQELWGCYRSRIDPVKDHHFFLNYKGEPFRVADCYHRPWIWGLPVTHPCPGKCSVWGGWEELLARDRYRQVSSLEVYVGCPCSSGSSGVILIVPLLSHLGRWWFLPHRKLQWREPLFMGSARLSLIPLCVGDFGEDGLNFELSSAVPIDRWKPFRCQFCQWETRFWKHDGKCIFQA